MPCENHRFACGGVRKGFALGLSLSLAFIPGCISAGIIIPPGGGADARQRWDCFLNSTDWNSVIKPLNAAGALGWELVSFRGEAGDAVAVM